MNKSRPSLLDLVAWTEESAPQLRAWRESSADAESVGAMLDDAVARLDAGEWLGDASAVAPELLSAYLDGSLPEPESRLIEDACLSSPAALAELVSEWRFRQSPPAATPSRTLEQRLLSLASAVPTPVRLDALPSLPMGTAVSEVKSDSAESTLSASPSVTKIPVVRATRRASTNRRGRRFEPWQIAGAALVVLATIGSAVAVYFSRHPAEHEPDPRIANDREGPRPSGNPPSDLPRPKLPERDGPERLVEQPREKNSAADPPDPEGNPQPDPTNMRPRKPEGKVVQTPAPARPKPPGPDPVPERPAPRAVARLNVQTELGMLLVRSDDGPAWRVAHDSYPLDRPLRLASLDHTWGTAEIPNVGTLVYQGETAATVQWDEDGTLRIDVEQGKLGVQNLVGGTRVNVRAGSAQFSAVGVGPYSTMAVVNDPLTPGAFVSSGIIDVAGAQVASNQMIRFNGSTANAPQPLAESKGARTSLFGANPYDPEWLGPPTDRERKEWRSQDAKLLDKLRETDDVAAVIGELRTQVKDARQQSMLARWSFTLAENKAQVVWGMINDRQELVRKAGVECLLDSPTREQRALLLGATMREAVGDAAADRVIEWVIAARRAPQLSANHAREMVESLQHNHLAIRQIAVSLLEYHSAAAFQQARRKPPAYDAAGPIAKRAAGQLEWRQIVGQLYSPNRAPRKA